METEAKASSLSKEVGPELCQPLPSRKTDGPRSLDSKLKARCCVPVVSRLGKADLWPRTHCFWSTLLPRPAVVPLFVEGAIRFESNQTKAAPIFLMAGPGYVSHLLTALQPQKDPVKPSERASL